MRIQQACNIAKLHLTSHLCMHLCEGAVVKISGSEQEWHVQRIQGMQVGLLSTDRRRPMTIVHFGAHIGHKGHAQWTQCKEAKWFVMINLIEYCPKAK